MISGTDTLSGDGNNGVTGHINGIAGYVRKKSGILYAEPYRSHSHSYNASNDKDNIIIMFLPLVI